MTPSAIILTDKVRTAILQLPDSDRRSVINALDDELLHRRTIRENLLTPVQRAMVALLSFHIRRASDMAVAPGLTTLAEIV